MWEPSDSSNPTTLNNPNKIEDYNTVFQSEGLFMRNGLGYIFHDNFWFKLNETAKVSYEQSKFVAYSSNYLDKPYKNASDCQISLGFGSYQNDSSSIIH